MQILVVLVYLLVYLYDVSEPQIELLDFIKGEDAAHYQLVNIASLKQIGVLCVDCLH